MRTVQLKFGLLSSPATPELKATSGNLPSGDYYVQLTATVHRASVAGETLPSPEAHIRLDSPGGIGISLPEIDNPCKMNLTGYNVYIGTSPGGETLQGSVEQHRGTYTQNTALSAGTRPPSVNTAGFNVHKRANQP
jgi:hypothetical protein